MSESITDLMMNIAASVYAIPCTFEELCQRDFLKSRWQYGVYMCVKEAERKKWIWIDRKGVLHCYKTTAKNILNPHGYELNV